MELLEGSELCFPQLLNTSCRKTVRPQSAAMLISILLSFISLLTATLNLLVIISISHYKQLHTPTNLLLLSLAVSDFFISLLMLLQIMLIDGCWYFGDVLCAVYYVSDYVITSASIGTMVLISVDRYLAICDPMHYSTKVTQQRVKICVSICWVCATVFHTVRFKNNLKQVGRFNSCVGQCVLVIDYAAGLSDLILSFIGPVTVIVILYMRVFVVAVSQAQAMRSHIIAVSLTVTRTSVGVMAKKSELKAARTLGIVIVVFLICLCPYYCVTLTGQEAMINASSAVFIICLFYFNSCLNPLIYALFYPWFRKSIKLIVTLQILKTDSSQANVL
ncbi:trace amine-associated receptor 8a-like [Plectropomus leopardus]|uniref:trace amine-associated receptor 8a-like n=1 Tax=Plectropomus leopardus TaxID=160734 RepID=UPI001C4D44C9|nr:trace amine-associated receptor 8a-like [Plectropomus leopardus]